MLRRSSIVLSFRFFFFFNDTATTEIYTLSLHDALPISSASSAARRRAARTRPRPARGSGTRRTGRTRRPRPGDRKSTRLNSSHSQISYAVFCLKKKKTHHHEREPVRTPPPQHSAHSAYT